MPHSPDIGVAAVAPQPMRPSLTHQASPSVSSSYDNIPAAELLEIALFYLRSGDSASAAEAFQAAVNTDYLSDAGRAVAYWYIHLAEKAQGHEGSSIDALASFVVLSEDLLDERDAYSVGQNGTQEFINQFDLRRRLSLARAVMSATWSQKASQYGRTSQDPIPVHDHAEVSYFIELVSPCPNRVGALKREAHLVQEQVLESVTLQCGQSTTPIQYYFEFKAPAVPGVEVARRL